MTARIALQHHKGLIQLGQTRTFRSSTTGSLFTGKAVKASGFCWTFPLSQGLLEMCSVGKQKSLSVPGEGCREGGKVLPSHKSGTSRILGPCCVAWLLHGLGCTRAGQSPQGGVSALIPRNTGILWGWDSGEPSAASILILIPLQETKFGDYNAVIVEVSGEAFYTGTATFTVEEEDPLKHGFFFK